jgi:hypothetical protein
MPRLRTRLLALAHRLLAAADIIAAAGTSISAWEESTLSQLVSQADAALDMLNGPPGALPARGGGRQANEDRRRDGNPHRQRGRERR